MEKFKDFKYVRPDYEVDKANFSACLKRMHEAETVEDFITEFDEYNVLRKHYMTMEQLCSVRHSIDTSDKFYEDEMNYWDEVSPSYEMFTSLLYKEVLGSKFLPELKERIAETFFKYAEFSLKAFDEKLIPYMQEENKLVTKYTKLIASASIEFDGEKYNLYGMAAVALSDDRALRERAFNARINWFAQHEAEFDSIYDELVKVRDEMAKVMGYDNYIELGYLRMNRFDYNEDMVANYRKQVLEGIVPLAQELYEKQKNRLGLDSLRYFDEKYEFLSGNPKPKGTPDELVQKALKMYKEMSPETGEFFQMMVDRELLDLVSKPNKQGGGYCTGIADYKVPFIFSNFNGTSGDVDVLTHEAGHAFQAYSSRHLPIPECAFPTMESAEIHSMSMEFFAWPWTKYFFEEEDEKYHYHHLASAITFMPYGVLVDHFQHEVYRNPKMTAEERKACWRNLEKQYLPHKDYEGCNILDKGGWWYQQGHIFSSPFYYIDYTLAQICALQFFTRIQSKDPNAWADYYKICQVGGSKTFTNICKEGNIIVPFEDGCIDSVVDVVRNTLNAIDDTKL